MRYVLSAVLCVVLLVGCEFYDTGKDVEAVSNKAGAAAVVVADSVGQAEGVIAALEDATGKTIDPATAGKLEDFFNKTAKYAALGQKGAVVGATVPGPQQPWAGAAAAALGAIGAVAGALGGLMERRRRRATEKGLRAVIMAVDDVPGVGKMILNTSVAAGVSELVQGQYATVKSP